MSAMRRGPEPAEFSESLRSTPKMSIQFLKVLGWLMCRNASLIKVAAKIAHLAPVSQGRVSGCQASRIIRSVRYGIFELPLREW